MTARRPLIRRTHLFELLDQSWFPETLRTLSVENLEYLTGSLGCYEPAVGKLQEVLEQTKEDHLLDLCSGGAGPVVKIAQRLEEELGRPIRVTLSDLFPHASFKDWRAPEGQSRVEYLQEPLDATDVPPGTRGFRTLFTGFHHFRREGALKVLEQAVKARAGIGVFEITTKCPSSLLSVLFVPLLLILWAPGVRPFRWSRLLWTWLIPILPLCHFWDGMVSVLRTYTPAELEELVAEIDAPDYEWKMGTLPVRTVPGRVTFLVGTPSAKQEGAGE